MRLPRVHDPGQRSLRTGARAAIVIPVAFAAGSFLFGDDHAGLFAAFGCFAPTVFANFGGTPRSRGLAYGVSAIVGAALVTVGTVLSGHAVAAALAAFGLVFGIRIAGVFGGHVERASSMLTLAFLLAVTTQVPVTALGPRLAGWLIGGALATIAALSLWPRYEGSRIVRGASDACGELAAAVRDPARAAAAERAVDEFRHEDAAAQFRPAGPSERERALARLVEEISRLAGYPPAPVRATDDERLAAAMAATLDAVAARLAGGRSASDLLALESARMTHAEAVAARAADALRHGISADEVLTRLDASFRLRVDSYVVLSISANSMIVTGAEIPPAEAFEVPPEASETSAPTELVRTAAGQLRSELSLSSARLQDAVRGGAGIAIATLVAITAGMSHGLWIVLGTLVALRSSALGTGRTALETILGTAFGVLLGGTINFAIGTDRAVQWIVLPITVFVAGYAPSALNFIAGKAAFTVFVLVLLSLIEPMGWDVGLMRLEHVAIGAGVSLAVGILLWPRGGREALRRSAAQAYHAAASYLAGAFAAVGADGAADSPPAGPGAGQARAQPERRVDGIEPMHETTVAARPLGRADAAADAADAPADAPADAAAAGTAEEAPGPYPHVAANGHRALDRSDAGRVALVAAIRRTSEAVRQQVGEPGRHLPPSTRGALLAAPRRVRAAGDSLRRIAERYPAPAPARAAWPAEFRSAADRVIAHYRALANALAAGPPGPPRAPHRTRTGRRPALEPPATPRLAAGFATTPMKSPDTRYTSARVERVTRAGAISALESWRAAPDDLDHRNVTLRLVWTRNWLISLDTLANEVTRPVNDVAATAAVPWWQQ